MINELTPEQEKLLETYRDKWLQIGLSCEPADRDTAERVIKKIYAYLEKKEPKIIWCDSPLSANYMINILKNLRLDKLGPTIQDQVEDRVWDQVDDQVWDQVLYQVRDQVYDQVDDQVWDQVMYQVRDQVRGQVRAQVARQVRAQIRDEVKGQAWGEVGRQIRAEVRDEVEEQVGRQIRAEVEGQVWRQVLEQIKFQIGAQVGRQIRAEVEGQVWRQMEFFYTSLYGQYDAYWLSFYDYMHQVLGINYKFKDVMTLDDWIDLSQSCGFWYAFENCVFCCEKPEHIKIEDGRLHCQTGSSIEFRDGFKVYSWRGVRIPPEWIEDKLPDPKEVFNIENMEQRHAACQMIGWDKIIDGLDAKIIDKDPDPTMGVLLECDLPDHGAQRFLKVFDPCGSRTHVIAVPMDMQRARQANAGMWGLTEDEYNPEVQT